MNICSSLPAIHSQDLAQVVRARSDRIHRALAESFLYQADADGRRSATMDRIGGWKTMASRDTELWMWSEACDMLVRAERLRGQFFHLHPRQRAPSWAPPVDVLETEQEVLVLVALPGVDQDEVQVVIEGADLVIVGHRVLPAELRTAVIHRLELPQGRFERRVPLPYGRYSGVRRAISNGCLVVALAKAA
jgi:HSP20 family molecular chaperone IbpA